VVDALPVVGTVLAVEALVIGVVELAHFGRRYSDSVGATASSSGRG
jgi:hypothetical protein